MCSKSASETAKDKLVKKQKKCSKKNNGWTTRHDYYDVIGYPYL